MTTMTTASNNITQHSRLVVCDNSKTVLTTKRSANRGFPRQKWREGSSGEFLALSRDFSGIFFDGNVVVGRRHCVAPPKVDQKKSQLFQYKMKKTHEDALRGRGRGAGVLFWAVLGSVCRVNNIPSRTFR